MQFSVQYEDGVWYFSASSGENEDDYLEEFEINNLADAKAAAADLILELRAVAEADEDEEDDDGGPFDKFLNELDS
jgi:hypothetical protein